MIGRDSVPRLAPRARLRWDRRGGGYLLLAPEKGLALDATAADVLLLCSGERTVAAIALALAEKYAADPARVEADVVELLDALANRALIQVAS